MIEVQNAVIINNNVSLIKCTHEETDKVLACCTTAAHCSQLEDLDHCENKIQPAHTYLCAGMSAPPLFPVRPLILWQGRTDHKVTEYIFGVVGMGWNLVAFWKSLRSILQTTEASGLFYPPLGLGESHMQPLDLCMGRVVMHNRWIICKSAQLSLEYEHGTLISASCGFDVTGSSAETVKGGTKSCSLLPNALQ